MFALINVLAVIPLVIRLPRNKVLFATSSALPAPLINTFDTADISPPTDSVPETTPEPNNAAAVTDKPVPVPFKNNVPVSFV